MDPGLLLERLNKIKDPDDDKTDRGSYSHLSHFFAESVLKQFSDMLPHFVLARVLLFYKEGDLSYKRTEANAIPCPCPSRDCDKKIVAAMAALIAYIGLVRDERARAITHHLLHKYADKSLVLLTHEDPGDLPQTMVWERMPRADSNLTPEFKELAGFLARKLETLQMVQVLAADSSGTYDELLKHEKKLLIKSIVEKVVQKHKGKLDGDSGIRLDLSALLLDAAGCNSFWLAPNPFPSRELHRAGLYLLSPDTPSRSQGDDIQRQSVVAAILAREVFLRSHVLEQGYRQAKLESEAQEAKLFHEIREPLDNVCDLIEQLGGPFTTLQSILSPAKGLLTALRRTETFFPIDGQMVKVNPKDPEVEVKGIHHWDHNNVSVEAMHEYLEHIAAVLLTALGKHDKAALPLWEFLQPILLNPAKRERDLVEALKKLAPCLRDPATLKRDASPEQIRPLFQLVKNCFQKAKAESTSPRRCPIQFLLLLFHMWVPEEQIRAPKDGVIYVATPDPSETGRALLCLCETVNGFEDISLAEEDNYWILRITTKGEVETHSSKTRTSMIKQYNRLVKAGSWNPNQSNWSSAMRLLMAGSRVRSAKHGFTDLEGRVRVAIPGLHSLEIYWTKGREPD